jgi:hypothetical protein
MPKFKTSSEKYLYEAATLANHKLNNLDTKAEWAEYRQWLSDNKIGTPPAVDKKADQFAVWDMSAVKTTPRERLEAFL